MVELRIAKISLRGEHDIVVARQLARTVAKGLGFSGNDQTRVGTAVSEIARNAFLYAGGGEFELLLTEKDQSQALLARIADHGPGFVDLAAVLEGRYRSTTGMGLGVAGAKRLMDDFRVESDSGRGATVLLWKMIPPGRAPVTPRSLAAISLAAIADRIVREPAKSVYQELWQQNQELLRATQELIQRQEDLKSLNRELEDTNRGIMALYAELDDKATNLARANQLKTRFLSAVSHEIKTPLNSVLAISRILMDRTDGELTPEQEKQVGLIRQSAAEVLELVSDLLDTARIQAGKITVRCAETHVCDLFSALRGMLKPLVLNPAVKLVVEDPEGVPAMMTDEGKVARILRNFVINAIKFTERGEIRVRAAAAPDGATVEFSVCDSGIGIAAEYLDSIFDEYTQVDSPLQRKAGGTGIGLSVCRKYAELLGGCVTVESVIGKGSRFAAIIPTVCPNVEILEGGPPPKRPKAAAKGSL